MKKNFSFKIITKDKKTKARVGEFTTPHGIIKTPAFVAVGTQATVKSLSPLELNEIGVQLLFGNTYHLHLRPGEEVIKSLGGLGEFMKWEGPTITDSGGFQVFSLGQKKIKLFADEEETEVNIVNIKEEGVVFRSHIDGSKHVFTPEISIEIQKKLGADLILSFDECAPYPATHEYTKEAMDRTHLWAKRSLQAFKNKKTAIFPQAIYGIIQGGIYKDLREESAEFISSLNFDAIAIGGVSVGESKKEMRDALEWTSPYLPEDKPRHLLGIGEIDDIFDAVKWGMDTFDCVIPTRFGRYGIIFVAPPNGSYKNKFRLDINKTQFARDKKSLDPSCLCAVCKTYTRAYIHHLFRAKELLAYRLAAYHNLFFLVNLTHAIRLAILEDRFGKMKQEWIGNT